MGNIVYIYKIFAWKPISLENTLNPRLFVISGQQSHFVITNTQLFCTPHVLVLDCIYYRRYSIHWVVLWDALSHVMADSFLFITFFWVYSFFFFIELTFNNTGIRVQHKTVIRYSLDVNMYIHVAIWINLKLFIKIRGGHFLRIEIRVSTKSWKLSHR